jgi:uncharacterized metal-binding protein YceD (DUF177 family)
MSTKHAEYRHSQANKPAEAVAGARLVSVDRLTRLQKLVEGTFPPAELPGLADYLATPSGKISYRLSGNIVSDQSGRQQKRLQCIISGWFEVLDAVTLLPSRFELDIDSRLVLVSSEDELPPLEDEADDEDFIVCAQDFDITSHVQEEILLVLPITTPRNGSLPDAALPKTLRMAGAAGVAGKVEGKRESPFAKLQALKKSR